ncbi:MAG TPA: SRPBCC family protein [Methylophilus sp.]
MHVFKSALMAIAALGFSASALAAEPLYVVKSVELNQPADAVWAKVSNFGDLGAWHPAVAKTEIVAGQNNRPGAKRVLTLQDGGKINETLIGVNAREKTYAYRITDGVLPVSEYVSTVSVHSNGGGKSVVVWESHFLPKPGSDEKAASDTIKSVYDAGLNNLKKAE